MWWKSNLITNNFGMKLRFVNPNGENVLVTNTYPILFIYLKILLIDFNKKLVK